MVSIWFPTGYTGRFEVRPGVFDGVVRKERQDWGEDVSGSLVGAIRIRGARITKRGSLTTEGGRGRFTGVRTPEEDGEKASPVGRVVNGGTGWSRSWFLSVLLIQGVLSAFGSGTSYVGTDNFASGGVFPSPV